MSRARSFVRRLSSVPEDAMRTALWREAFAVESADDLLACVDEALDELEGCRSPLGEIAYRSLVEYLESSRGQPDPGRRALYEAASAAGRQTVMRLLLSRPAVKTAVEDTIPMPVLDADREVTLGERRSLARSLDRDVLNRLLYDVDPGVLGNLLANPRLTEYDVLKIASRRPNTAVTLSMLFRHSKWGRRREVQKALVFNPYTPGDIALALVPVIDPTELPSLSTDGMVHAVVRARALELLAARPARPVELDLDGAFELPDEE